jgi:hypothetical protein
MTGKLLRAGTAPPHLITLIGPRSAMVSPLMKWLTTRMTRYPMDISAITLVYFSESSRRRKDRGITISLAQCQCFSVYLTSSDLHKTSNPEMTVNQKVVISDCVIESPYNARHQISNYNQVADSYSETLDRNRRIEYHRGIRVCNL